MKSMLLVMRKSISRGVIIAFFAVLFLTVILLFRIKQVPLTAPVIMQQKKTVDTTNEENLLAGNWQYMPGVTKDESGLTVTPIRFEIINQNATLSEYNPQINLVGTHIQNINGDFEINATLSDLTGKTATIQFYGQPPLIADEFRVERESLKVQIGDGSIRVELWDGSKQTPAITRSYPVTVTDTVDFKLVREGEDLFFYSGSSKLGSINESNIFGKGQIWFGLESKNGGWKLTKLTGHAINNSNFDVADAATTTVMDPEAGLQSLASLKRPGFLVGVAEALGPLASDSDYAKTLLNNNNFGIITPENDMKMINLQPERGVYSFQKADALVALATQNGQKVHGHSLVFGEANPTWFNSLPTTTSEDKQVIKDIMIDHITTVVSHFKDSIYSWDVVNEPLADYDDMDKGVILRKHKWNQAMGESFIVTALEAAYKANPEAQLFINEYGLEFDGERWDNFIALINRLKLRLAEKHIPVDHIGVGFQSHVYSPEDKIDVNTLKAHIRALQALGLKVQISEMDVESAEGDNVQARQYADVFNACLSEPNCVGWKAWILSDRYDLWRDDNGEVRYGVDGLYDKDMKERPAIKAMLDSLK